MFHYFCGEVVSPEEAAYRRARIDVMDAFRRVGVQTASKMPPEFWGGTPELLKERQAALSAFPQFLVLNREEKHKAKLGKFDPFHPVDFAAAINVHPDVFKIYWELFAGATHAGPLQFIDMATRWSTEPKQTLAWQFSVVQHAMFLCGKALEKATEQFVHHEPQAIELQFKGEADFVWRRLRPKFISLSSAIPGPDSTK